MVGDLNNYSLGRQLVRWGGRYANAVEPYPWCLTCYMCMVVCCLSFLISLLLD